MDYEGSCPLPYADIVDAYFLEHRAKLIDLAAFLDRLDRAAEGAADPDDFRIAAFKRAIAMLTDGEGQRARRVLNNFTDTTTDMAQSAEGMKGALGAAPEPTA
jgi:hypothetical protein